MPVPVLGTEATDGMSIAGWLGERIHATLHHWMLHMPGANPALLQMFRDRDGGGDAPSRKLLPWSGEFAGKYLIAASQFVRLTRDPELIASVQTFVDDLIAGQDRDGYQGAFEQSARMLGRPESRVWTTFFPGVQQSTQWNEWFALDDRAIPQGASIATLSTARGGTSLYVVDLDGKVSANFFPPPDAAPQWSGWFALGEKGFPSGSTVTALSTRPGGTSLYVLGDDGQVWTNFSRQPEVRCSGTAGLRLAARRSRPAAVSARSAPCRAAPACTCCTPTGGCEATSSRHLTTPIDGAAGSRCRASSAFPRARRSRR